MYDFVAALRMGWSKKEVKNDYASRKKVFSRLNNELKLLERFAEREAQLKKQRGSDSRSKMITHAYRMQNVTASTENIIVDLCQLWAMLGHDADLPAMVETLVKETINDVYGKRLRPDNTSIQNFINRHIRNEV